MMMMMVQRSCVLSAVLYLSGDRDGPTDPLWCLSFNFPWLTGTLDSMSRLLVLIWVELSVDYGRFLQHFSSGICAALKCVKEVCWLLYMCMLKKIFFFVGYCYAKV